MGVIGVCDGFSGGCVLCCGNVSQAVIGVLEVVHRGSARQILLSGHPIGGCVRPGTRRVGILFADLPRDVFDRESLQSVVGVADCPACDHAHTGQCAVGNRIAGGSVVGIGFVDRCQAWGRIIPPGKPAPEGLPPPGDEMNISE